MPVTIAARSYLFGCIVAGLVVVVTTSVEVTLSDGVSIVVVEAAVAVPEVVLVCLGSVVVTEDVFELLQDV